MPLDEFLQKIKKHFVECNTYTRATKSLNFHVSEIPPVVAPKLSGDQIWNTEMEKKSQFLKKQAKSAEGKMKALGSSGFIMAQLKIAHSRLAICF